MKKIAIVTLYGLYNYGNRLQNYATQEIFKDLGYEVESIVCQRSRYRYIVHMGYNLLKPLFGKDSLRVWRFLNFNNRYIVQKIFYKKDMKFSTQLSKEYLAFVVGSDQVWNPNMRQDERYNFFLQFAKKSQRISLAPSIAVKKIPEEYINIYKDGFNGFDSISVREKSSVELVKEIAGKNAKLLVDPTLALASEKWSFLAEKASKSVRTNEPYLLTYFLGKVTEEFRSTIDQLAKENHLRVINLNDLSDKKYHSCTPDEFLYLIKHATLFITDSFHGCVFSIIFHTPFLARERENTIGEKSGTESRIISLLEMFALDDRYNCVPSCVFDINFDHADEMLNLKRKEFMSYIENELSRVERDVR